MRVAVAVAHRLGCRLVGIELVGKAELLGPPLVFPFGVRASQDRQRKLPVLGMLLGRGMIELDHAATKEHPEDREFALAILRGSNSERKYEWWTEKLGFPYKLDTYQPAPQPVGDGHGHAH